VELRGQGETGAAISVLRQAVDLAWPGGFIRVFVDLGRPMQAMLHRLAKHGYPVERINHILAAFPEYEKVEVEQPYGQSHGNSTSTEPLTPRELEILQLLRGPASNKEIAKILNISYETVRRHIANIYDKLGVNGRWKAVARAEELNILPPR
jgi:ATP/maltotriose-dependent transcriptional regulator MalT